MLFRSILIQHFTVVTPTNQSGKIGLFHNVTSDQSFDNVKVLNKDGKTIFEDNFDEPDGRASNWIVAFGGWEEIEPGIGPQLDAIGFHICYGHDPDSGYGQSYRQIIEKLRRDSAKHGFKGILSNNEWTYYADYPGHPEWSTEMSKAKYASQLMTLCCGMDVMSLYNETFQTGMIAPDVTMFRNCFSVDPISSTQPQPIYYVLRNISTVMDNYNAYDFDLEFTTDKKLDFYTFSKNKKEFMFAVWITGRTKDGIVESKSDITISDIQAKKARVIDVFNGTKQELNITPTGTGTILKEMLIKDYPVFVCLSTE